MRTLTFWYGFSGKAQMHFAKRLAFLMSSGTPLLIGLRILREQASSPKEGMMLDVMISDVESGKNLSESMKRFRRQFGGFAVNIIRAGEFGGILHQNLSYLADELEKKQELKRKIIGALFYPLFIFCATFMAAGFLVLFVFPKITPIFKSMRIELPQATSFLIAATEFLLAYGLSVIVGIIALGVLCIFLYARVYAFRRFIHRLFLRPPIIGTLIKDYYLAGITRTIGLLLESNIRIVQALTIASETTENLVYREVLQHISRTMQEGKKMSQECKRYAHILTSLLCEMTAVGEASGNLAGTFLYLSRYFERELESRTKNFANAIEPALMICMGLVVGYVVVSVITPIYGITEHLTPR